MRLYIYNEVEVEVEVEVLSFAIAMAMACAKTVRTARTGVLLYSKMVSNLCGT